jgi:hypothetical protein
LSILLLRKLNKKIYGSSQKSGRKYKNNIKNPGGEIERVNGSVL